MVWYCVVYIYAEIGNTLLHNFPPSSAAIIDDLTSKKMEAFCAKDEEHLCSK